MPSNAYSLHGILPAAAATGSVQGAVDELQRIWQQHPHMQGVCNVLIGALTPGSFLYSLVDVFVSTAAVYTASVEPCKKPYLWLLHDFSSMGKASHYELYGWDEVEEAMDRFEDFCIHRASGEEAFMHPLLRGTCSGT